jgi:trans-2,3-dihydro-3-hydroxyanthranilate isomerase
MARHCYVLRVFTRDGEGGNHLGVVTDTSGLSDTALQEIATELGYSETIYLDWRDQEMPKVRIFTPASELPFAGHPLVGMTWLLNKLGPGGTGEIECGIGRVVSRMDGEVAWIDAPLNQPVALGADLPPTHDPGVSPVHVAMVEMPIPYHVVELADSESVAAVGVPADGMVAFYTWLDETTIHTRFFAPGHGVPEDPATGSAAVALAASLRSRGRTGGKVTVFQGEEMGFASQIELRWSDASASIGGRVVKDDVLWLER